MGVSKNREVVLAWTRRGRVHELLLLLGDVAPELRDRLRRPLDRTVAAFEPQLRMSADGVLQVRIPASAAAAAPFVPSSSPPLAGASSGPASSAPAVAPQAAAAAAAAPVAEAERSRPKRNVKQTERGAEMAAEKKTAEKADGKKFKAAESDKLPEDLTWSARASQCRSTSMGRGLSLWC
jgi:hypothetical protein